MRVLKFGGKSLSTINHIEKLAQKISTFQNKQIVIIVSAMGNATSELIRLSSPLLPLNHPTFNSQREMDMLLASGERVSAALFSLALQKFGVPSVSFTGSQAGVFTAGEHNNASISELRPIRIQESLEKGLVPIVAGFQGVDPKSKNVTTLGRGGSDLTAMAFANHYSCTAELYKTVGGIHTCDPHLFSNELKTKVLPQLTLSALDEFARWGGKIIHHKASSFAEKNKTPISFHSDQTFSIQTQIKDNSSNSYCVLSLKEHSKDFSWLSFIFNNPPHMETFRKLRNKFQPSALKEDSSKYRISFLVKKENKPQLLKEMHQDVLNQFLNFQVSMPGLS